MKTETKRAVGDAFAKLDPRCQAKNPVMLMVYASAILVTALFALSLAGISDAPSGYIAAIAVVLWATVLFGNFAESLAEGRGRPRPTHCGPPNATWRPSSWTRGPSRPPPRPTTPQPFWPSAPAR